MSIGREQRRVFVEFPNFGLGPATTLLSLVEPIIGSYSWHVVSCGGAAEFVGRHLPSAVVHELDTFSSATWPGFLRLAPPGSVVVSVTNPPFAGWAAGCGYRVGVVDTLDWMWDSPPPGTDQLQFHLVQHYFGPHLGPGLATPHRQLIRPVVHTALWRAGDTERRDGTAVVGFGGMAIPGRDRGTGDYVRWFLSAALPVLLDHAGCRRVAVVGGRRDLQDLIPPQWRRHDAVEVYVGVDRAAYAAWVREAEHLLLAPGLGTLYECAAAGLTPLIQPGFSMSMVLQARAVRAAGYPHVAVWPWLDQATTALKGMAELEGLQMLARLIDRTVRQDQDECGLTKALMSYVDRQADDVLTFSTVALPDGRVLLADCLRRLA